LKGAAEPAGGVNAPAPTDRAAVMVVFASFRSASFSQVCAAAVLELKASEANARTENGSQTNLRRDVSRLLIFILQESSEVALEAREYQRG
jgi:hypothetical protein